MKRSGILVVGLALATLFHSAVEAQYVSDNPDLLSHGKQIYARECAACHGDAGEGDGPGARYLAQRPRNLTLGVFKVRSTPSGQFPIVQDIFNSITEGLVGSHGAQMPSFASLSERERWALVEVVRDFAWMDEEGKPITVPPRPATSDLDLGREVYDRLQCTSCHGDMGFGDGGSSLTLKDDDKRRIFAANLRDGRYKGGDAPEDVWTRLFTGMDGSPMPSYAGKASDDELWALTDFILNMKQASSDTHADQENK